MAGVDRDVLRQLIAEQINSLPQNPRKGAGKGSGESTPRRVWGCPCGEKANWLHRLTCRRCDAVIPAGVTAAAGAASWGQEAQQGQAGAGGRHSLPSARSSLAGTPGHSTPQGAVERAAPETKGPRDLAVTVPAGDGDWVNLSEERDELLVQLIKTRSARQRLRRVQAAAQSRREGVEELKAALKAAHQELQAAEEETKAAKAAVTWEEGRLVTAKLRELGGPLSPASPAGRLPEDGWTVAPPKAGGAIATDPLKGGATYGGTGMGAAPKGAASAVPVAEALAPTQPFVPPEEPLYEPCRADPYGSAAMAVESLESVASGDEPAGAGDDSVRGPRPGDAEGRGPTPAGSAALATASAAAKGKSAASSRRTSRRASLESVGEVFAPKTRKKKGPKGLSQKARKAQQRAALGHVGDLPVGGQPKPLTVAGMLRGLRT